MTATAGSLLAQHQFVRFWCGRVASVFAYQMLSVAVGWQVYALVVVVLFLRLFPELARVDALVPTAHREEERVA
jgi:hypothetical protein